MGRSLHPDDRLPRDAPAYAEEAAIRWELPVRVNGTSGVLVIREYDDDYPRDRRRFEGASVRGRLVLLLDAQRRNTK